MKQLPRIAEKFLWKLASFLAPTTKSMPHASSLDHEPVHEATPIWVHGSARTGTTTSMNLIASAFGRNKAFEPLHLIRDPDFDEVSRSMDLFLSSPVHKPDINYVREDGILAALQSFPDEGRNTPEGSAFDSVIDSIYGKYGRNVVVKEIRLFANLPALASYHQERSIPWLFLGIIANPTVPLYSMYRRGGLCNNAPVSQAPIQSGYEYRVQTFSRLGMFDDLLAIKARTRMDQCALTCMFDQDYLRYFVSQDPEHRHLASLTEIFDEYDWISRNLGEEANANGTAGKIPSIGHGVDPWFYREVVEHLATPVREAIEARWGPIKMMQATPNAVFRRQVVSMRHRFFTSKAANSDQE